MSKIRELIAEAIANKFVVWHAPSSLYWRPNASGYTSELGSAGLYTQEEAERLARRRSPLSDGSYEDRASSLAQELKGAEDGTLYGMLLALVDERSDDETPDAPERGAWVADSSVVPAWLRKVPDRSGRYEICDELGKLFCRFDEYLDLPAWHAWHVAVLAQIGDSPRPDRRRRRLIDKLRELRGLNDFDLSTCADLKDLLDAAIVELFELSPPEPSIRLPPYLHDVLLNALHVAERLDCHSFRELRELRLLVQDQQPSLGQAPWWKVGSVEHVAFWDAVNAYAAACGGDVERISESRVDAVVQVERAAMAWPGPIPAEQYDEILVRLLGDVRSYIFHAAVFEHEVCDVDDVEIAGPGLVERLDAWLTRLSVAAERPDASARAGVEWIVDAIRILHSEDPVDVSALKGLRHIATALDSSIDTNDIEAAGACGLIVYDDALEEWKPTAFGDFLAKHTGRSGADPSIDEDVAKASDQGRGADEDV